MGARAHEPGGRGSGCNVSEAKSQLSGLVEQVRALEEQVMITRNGRPAAVLVSADEFEGWKETIEVRGDAALDRLALDAEAGKALQGDLKGLRNLRVARFRVIYRAPARRVIEIAAIGPRERIYEEALRLVSVIISLPIPPHPNIRVAFFRPCKARPSNAR